MRRRYVQIGGVLYERGKEPVEQAGPMIMDDIEPYRSMIDGSLITSRSKHREHLRQHGCIELGNEALKAAEKAYTNIPDVAPQQRHELIRAQVDAMRHDEFKRMLKRDLDRIRWNSRSD